MPGFFALTFSTRFQISGNSTKFPMQNVASPSAALINLHEVHVWWRTPIETPPPRSFGFSQNPPPILAVIKVNSKKKQNKFSSSNLQNVHQTKKNNMVFLFSYLSTKVVVAG